MEERNPTNNDWINALTDRIVDSYHADPSTQHLDSTFLPSRARTVELIEEVRRLVFPGFFDDERLTSDTIHDHVRRSLGATHGLLYEQIRQALRYDLNRKSGQGSGDNCTECDDEAHRLAMDLLDRIPKLRRKLQRDVRSAFDGDPAAGDTDETIFCYPGLDAIFMHRLAHELWTLQIPMLPRIISEYAHNETGIDIHPGAQIGESFFIDHGTGVVVGETTTIGDRVKLYQGVTLGALSTKGGQAWRGRKRHPTIEDDVTIYGGAIILGGETVIGRGSTIGGAVFLTQSVPPNHTVSMKPPQLKMSARRSRAADLVIQPDPHARSQDPPDTLDATNPQDTGETTPTPKVKT